MPTQHATASRLEADYRIAMRCECRRLSLSRHLRVRVLLKSARYYLAACIIAVWASLADFAMLSGQGWTVTDGCRQFFYAR